MMAKTWLKFLPAFVLLASVSAANHDRGIISNTTQCEAVGGSCSASADCDLSSNVFVGSCDDTSLGCCVSKDDVCVAGNGECMSAAECDAKSDYRVTLISCSDGVCCVPRRSSLRKGGNGTSRDSPNGEPSNRGRMMSNTTQCEDVGGTCSTFVDCDLSSNVFVGSCDDTSFGCCISKDDVCVAGNGECLSAAECDTKSDYRVTLISCSKGVCCVPRIPSPRNGGNGTGAGSSKRGKNGEHMGPGPRGRLHGEDPRGSRTWFGPRGRRPGHDNRHSRGGYERLGSRWSRGGHGGRRGHGGRAGQARRWSRGHGSRW